MQRCFSSKIKMHTFYPKACRGIFALLSIIIVFNASSLHVYGSTVPEQISPSLIQATTPYEEYHSIWNLNLHMQSNADGIYTDEELLTDVATRSAAILRTTSSTPYYNLNLQGTFIGIYDDQLWVATCRHGGPTWISTGEIHEIYLFTGLCNDSSEVTIKGITPSQILTSESKDIAFYSFPLFSEDGLPNFDDEWLIHRCVYGGHNPKIGDLITNFPYRGNSLQDFDKELDSITFKVKKTNFYDTRMPSYERHCIKTTGTAISGDSGSGVYNQDGSLAGVLVATGWGNLSGNYVLPFTTLRQEFYTLTGYLLNE